jgi:hypothetical protein
MRSASGTGLNALPRTTRESVGAGLRRSMLGGGFDGFFFRSVVMRDFAM